MAGPFQITPTNLNLFSPTQIPGCQLWLDGADSSSVVLSGTTITQWKDKSGLLNHTTATGGVTTYTANAINGLSAPYLNTTWLTGPFATAYTGNKVQAFAVATLVSTAGAYGRILSLGRPGANDYNSGDTTFMMCRNTAQNLMIGRAGSYLTVNIPAYSTPFLAQSSHNVNIESIGLNGILTPTTQNTGQAGNFNLTSYGIGTNTNTGDATYWQGYIGEVLYYTGVLTTVQIQQIEGYLAWKWGLVANLPAGHPYKTTPVLTSFPFPSVISPSINTVTSLPYTTNLAVFRPTQISGCQLWLDAADISSFLLSGTTVTSWNNKVPGGIATTTVSSPSLSGNYVNRIQTLRFNGNSITAALSTPVGTGDYAMFAVWLTINGGTEAVLSIGPNGGPAAGLGYNGAYYNLYEWGQTESQYVAGKNQYVVESGTRVSGIKTVFYNGNAATPASGTLNLTNPTLYVGNGTGFPINGEIGEVIVYQATLTVAQRQQVEGYLAWKWGLVSSLPMGHPYKIPPIAPFQYAIRQGGQVKFSPLSIPGCSLWLDAADASTFTLSGSTVTQWRDKSGNGRNATGSGTPTLTQNIQNKLPSIYFNGSSYLTGSLPNTTNQQSFFSVFRYNTGAPQYARLASFGVNGQFDYNNNAYYNLSYNTGTLAITRSPTETQVTLASPALDAFHQASIIFNGTNGLYYTDGGSYSNSAAWTTNFNFNQYRLGSDQIPFLPEEMIGYISEIIVYSSGVSTQQRQQIEGYLAWKWGLVGNLPANHPYKLFPPK